MKKNTFGKFQEERGSKKKERFRQEKKKARKETKEYFEKKKAEERKARFENRSPGFEGRKDRFSRDKDDTRRNPARARTAGINESAAKKTTTGSTRSERPVITKKASISKKDSFDKPASIPHRANQPSKDGHRSNTAQPAKAVQRSGSTQSAASIMPLNKFIAHSGMCSRRDAAEIVKSGKVTVNGETILEPGFKVSGNEEVKVNGKKIAARKNLVYILLNKPKDYITTSEDPQGRKTVLDIVGKATPERIYPIGRLDRNTTGVLLLTNDGELAQKLSHPSYEVKKIYEVKLDKPLAKKDFDTLLNGITLEDGLITPDGLAYADPKDKSVIGIEIHSGRNRIVRRIFEHLGYDVRNLDRVMYANLTKKNVERGKWRFLSEKEVRLLKFLNASYTRK